MNNETLFLIQQQFWYWIREREAIRRNREAFHLPPWTLDPILANNHFCNVRREDDRGTKEIRDVVKLHRWLEKDDLPWVYTLARMLNKAESLDAALREVLKGFDWWGVLKDRMDNGCKVFHTAYVVSTNGRSMNKLGFVHEVVEAVKSCGILPSDSLEEAYDKLITVRGIGSFLAGQVVADLKNDRYLVNAPDWFTWSCIGPGSKKGLDYIFGGGTTHRNYQERMLELYDHMPQNIHEMRIHAQDLQNCLCEFSKYMALREGTRGRSRPYKACK